MAGSGQEGHGKRDREMNAHSLVLERPTRRARFISFGDASGGRVLEISIDQHKILLTGDIEEDAERRLLDVLSDVDVLKVAHHGSKTSTSDDFIALLEPRFSVISVGEGNRFGHPHPETLWSLRESKVLRTDLHGVIQVEFEKGKMHFIE